MAKNFDVIVLGTSFRGLWLSAELVALGWKVAWIPLMEDLQSSEKGLDDWPWQVGPALTQSRLVSLSREFIEEVIRPQTQNLSVQILTLKGPLELSGPSRDGTIKNALGEKGSELKTFCDQINLLSGSDQGGRGRQHLNSLVSQLARQPFAFRWPVEWLGGLRRPRLVGSLEWVMDFDGELLNPSDPYWLLNDNIQAVTDRAISWATKKGVQVLKSKILDVGIDGKLATGVEVQGADQFLSCKHLVFSASLQAVGLRLPKFSETLKKPHREGFERLVWIRCGFKLKPGARPQGLQDFSSFVRDPFLPLIDGNFGLIKWVSGPKEDTVTVWSRVAFEDVSRRSYLTDLLKRVEQTADELFPFFSSHLQSVQPFEDYFESKEHTRDFLALVYDKKVGFVPVRHRYKNVWFAGPGHDRGLELLSRLATEHRLLTQLAVLRQKEIDRDRKIHAARNGGNLATQKPV
ncbi:MAG: hypothetical protein IT289_08715 [Oligoflexia bacterium]|nr:hypothetical protein [Oligoflexia bacterium]